MKRGTDDGNQIAMQTRGDQKMTESRRFWFDLASGRDYVGGVLSVSIVGSLWSVTYENLINMNFKLYLIRL